MRALVPMLLVFAGCHAVLPLGGPPDRTDGTPPVADVSLPGEGSRNDVHRVDGAPPGNPFVQVSAGYDHTCGRRQDGTVECWGRHVEGQASAPGGAFLAVSAGEVHSCGIPADGKQIACWGENTCTLATSSTATDVKVGIDQTCVLDGSGAVFCCGKLLLVDQPGPYTSLTVGETDICVIDPQTNLVCKAYGSGTPINPGPMSGLSQVAVGVDAGCAVKSKQVVCFGNDSGIITGPSTAGPAKQVTVGGDHACALFQDNSIQCWGDNNDGQANPPPGVTFSQIDAGEDYTCGVRTDGTISCWGEDADGQAPAHRK